MVKEEKAVEVTVLGEVQGVGYRRAVAKIARRLGVCGYIKNQSDESVKIIAEGESRIIDEFLGKIAIDRPPIRVESIHRKEIKPTGRRRSFAIKMGSLVNEVQEAMGSGEQQLVLLRKETGDNFGLLREETRGNFEALRKETGDNFGLLREETRGNFEALNSNLNEYKQDFKDYRKQFGEFASRTDNNFINLADKYGEISAKMSQLLETLERESSETRKELTRAVDHLSKLIDQYIKLQGTHGV